MQQIEAGTNRGQPRGAGLTYPAKSVSDESEQVRIEERSDTTDKRENAMNQDLRLLLRQATRRRSCSSSIRDQARNHQGWPLFHHAPAIRTRRAALGHAPSGCSAQPASMATSAAQMLDCFRHPEARSCRRKRQGRSAGARHRLPGLSWSPCRRIRAARQ